MRGRQPATIVFILLSGNTPAYAGKTLNPKALGLMSEKHPRVCGEDAIKMAAPMSFGETPPRMRGRLQELHLVLWHVGNTPAYAGKTRDNRRQSYPAWKHPRVCGEDLKEERHDVLAEETPPRMRGRPRRRVATCPELRNTPAYAGKT